MALYLTEADVSRLVGPEDAVAVVGELLAVTRDDGAARCAIGGGRDQMVVLAGTLDGSGSAGVSLQLGPASLSALFSSDPPGIRAVLEAGRLRALRAAATSAAAARSLALRPARSLGVIGCGRVGAAHVECLRHGLPSLERVVVYCRSEAVRRDVAERLGAEPAEYGTEAADCDVVVTATTSEDPVLRGEWLRAGALVCAAGAVTATARELDNVVLERAAFVCCDSQALAREAAGDLIEPVERGVLDWLEVHELVEALASPQPARQAPEDIVVYKNSGWTPLDLALAELAVTRAAEAGLGTEIS